MSWWAGIKAAIVGAGKTGDAIDTGLSIAKDISSGIDVMFYTQEEKAQAAMQAAPQVMDHIIKMNDLHNKSNTASSKIRRTLAKWIAGTVLGTFVWGCLVWTFAFYKALQAPTPEVTKTILEFAMTYLKGLVTWSQAMWIGSAFTAVVCLHFGYYGLTNIVKNIGNKKED